MFPDAQRRIFQYTANGQVLFADPMKTLIQLKLACRGRLRVLVAQHNVMQGYPPDIEAEEAATFTPRPPAEDTAEYLAGIAARQEIAAATISAFGLEPFDPASGSGTLEEEAIALFNAFMTYLNAKKNSGGT